MSDFNNIVFFDGYCNLCNASVDWIIKRDKKNVFKFASLQGETAKKVLTKIPYSLDSVVLYKSEKVYTHFKAIANIAKQLPFPYNMGIILYLIPDFLYQFIAKNRYRWFGKKETCRMPTPEERKLFLD